MTPKISIFVTLGNIGNTPDEWQYAWREAIQSYYDFADEVVIVSGMEKDVKLMDWTKNGLERFKNKKVKVIHLPWEYDFSWETIAQHFNAGLEACTGDWIMKMDIDYIIHERDMKQLRAKMEEGYKKNYPLMSFMKFTVLNKDRAYEKVHIPFIIRKTERDNIKFGIPTDDPKSAWGYPIFVKGFDKKRGLPTGRSIADNYIMSTSVRIYNYDNTFRDKETTGEHFLRFSKAGERAGFKRNWGNTREEALNMFCSMMWSRITKTQKCYKPLRLEDHPKYIRDRIKSLTPDLFGHSSWIE